MCVVVWECIVSSMVSPGNHGEDGSLAIMVVAWCAGRAVWVVVSYIYMYVSMCALCMVVLVGVVGV